MSTAPIHTRIWREHAEADNPFATRQALCHGFDVYGEMLGRARWSDMVYLLMCGQPPSPAQADLLDALAVALANPGPRDASVHAAMCGGIGGSTAAASLMAALAVGAGQSGGAREVFLAMQLWARCPTDGSQWLSHWQDGIRSAPGPTQPDDVWPDIDHAPGFDPHGVSTPLIVRQTLAVCASLSPGPRLAWLQAHLLALEECARSPLSLIGVAAAALADLGMSPVQGEMMHLLMRLPGAAAHALEQGDKHYRDFPFPALDLRLDPKHREPA
jgi:citrate synthase